MVISADFENQKQYFDQENIASSNFFIFILLVKVARQTRA
jgi:hypothetical protein